MREWIRFPKVTPQAYQIFREMADYLGQCGLEPSLLELVRLRASQINGCAYCIDIHTKEARAAGETEQRLYGLSAWRYTPFYSDRERAALDWAEAVTQIGENHVPDDVYENARQQFSEKELVDLTLAIVSVNDWGRMAICFNFPIGSYHPDNSAAIRQAPEPVHSS